jgi:hypothetical protein
MSKTIQFLLRSVFAVCAAFIIIVIGNIVIIAQTTGTWKATTDSGKDGEIHVSFSRDSERHGKNSFGSNFDFRDFEGLNERETLGSNTKVNFRLKREAGIIACEGSFTDGKGSGTFRFTPNQSFVSSMETLGFKLDQDKLFSAAALDVTTSFARDIQSLGFKNLDIEDVFKAKIFNVTPAYAAEMNSIGFPNLDMEDLVKARIFKIDADYARRVRDMGFSDLSMENMVKLSIFKVTPEFISELRGEGLVNLSIEDVVKLRIFKVDAEFIKKARSENVAIDVESLVSRRIGVWGKR